MNYFTADFHLVHKQIIKYCNRPFLNTQQMCKILIKNYNSLVKKDDTCYILGDFAMLRKREISKLEPILRKMNGRKILILGNHDEGNPFYYVKLGFESVHTSLELSNGWVLVHDPALACIDENRQFLCGHVHGLFKQQKNCINVGVDVNDFFPVSEETIKGMI